MNSLRSLIAILILFFLPISGANAEPGAPIVIGIDVSGSMRGEALSDAVEAAERIVVELAGRRNLELYTFNRFVERLTDSSALNQLSSGGYTALYDSVVELAERAKVLDAPLIILTDGKDSRSLLAPDVFMNKFVDFPVTINFVMYNPLPEDLSILAQVSKESGGQVYGVDQSNELIDVFSEAIIQVKRERRDTDNRTPALIGTAMGIVTLSILQLLRGWRSREKFLGSWGSLLDSYEIGGNQGTKPINTGPNKGLLYGVVGGDTSTVLPKVGGKSQREFIAIISLLSLIALFSIFGFPLIFSALLAIATGLLGLRTLVSRSARIARREFEDELPGSLRLIASSLTAGLSFLQALDTFSSENDSRVAREFRRALTEIQMGSPVERALGDVAERMESDDLLWVVFAFSIQREVGGGLAKILQTSAETIDTRASLRQEMRTLSTEGRISSYILMLLPPGIFVFLTLVRRDFVSIFWQESIGNAMLLAVILLMTCAWIWIRRLVTPTT